MSYIGVDLHTTQITVCYLTEKDEISIRKYQLWEIEKFVSGLSGTDEIAVEATGNTRWFAEQVKDKVRRVALVNPRQFEVVNTTTRLQQLSRCSFSSCRRLECERLAA